MIDIKDFQPWDAELIKLRKEMDDSCRDPSYLKELWTISHCARTFSHEGTILFCTGLSYVGEVDCIWMIVSEEIKTLPYLKELVKAIKNEIDDNQVRPIIALIDEEFEEGKRFARFFGFKPLDHKEFLLGKERQYYIRPLTEASSRV